MCGRFDRHSSLRNFTKVLGELDIKESDDLAGSYNVAPSQRALVIRHGSTGLIASALEWGLIPPWAKRSEKTWPINARAETIHKRGIFRRSFFERRCLILCDGFYEWRKQSDGSKQPYYFCSPEQSPFVLAGIWERNNTQYDKPIDTFCILTTSAGEGANFVHRRMPIRLASISHESWLNPKISDVAFLCQLIESAGDEWLFYPVSKYVNSPRNDSSRCVAPLQNTQEIL